MEDAFILMDTSMLIYNTPRASMLWLIDDVYLLESLLVAIMYLLLELGKQTIPAAKLPPDERSTPCSHHKNEIETCCFHTSIARLSHVINRRDWLSSTEPNLLLAEGGILPSRSCYTQWLETKEELYTVCLRGPTQRNTLCFDAAQKRGLLKPLRAGTK